MANSIRFSIIIPTYNNWAAISTVLPRVVNATRSYNNVEIIVVDSSVDGTEKRIVKSFPDIKLVHRQKRILPGPARNLGAKKSFGEILIFLDGDCVPSEGWFKGFFSIAGKLKDNVVCGSVDIQKPYDLSQFMEYIIWKISENSRVKEGKYGFVITENMMISKKNFTRTGGFEKSDSANDAQMDVARRKAGLGIYFRPTAQVFHIHPSGWNFHFLKMYRIGQEQFKLMVNLRDYRVGRLMAYFFPVVFLVKWLRISLNIIRYRVEWLSTFALIQPMLWLALLFHQFGLWRGLLTLAVTKISRE